MSEQAYKSFRAAIEMAVARFNRMDNDGRLEATIAIIDESGLQYSEQETVVSLLGRVAEEGSIEAAALMCCFGASHEQVATALAAIGRRSPDVTNGMAIEGLTVLIEEWAEEEVAAGRMIKTVCPETGRNLYQNVEEKP